MLIFVSGHYPILGTQMLYFSDPALAPRAEIPPPTEFFALEEERIVSQPLIERTPNVVSRPEVVSGDSVPECATYARAMEKGFIEELEWSKSVRPPAAQER
jgi:hypothetical protein